MITVLQRVSEASVAIDGTAVGQIGHGYMILVCAVKGDEDKDALVLAEKISKLRVFSDENGKMNRSVIDVGGSALVVSQFTLCANYVHGNRPDFLASAAPDEAKRLYELFVSLLGERIGKENIATGEFGADMRVSLVNDGPVTIIMESDKLKK